MKANMIHMANADELDPDWPLWFTVFDDTVDDDDGLVIDPDMIPIAESFVDLLWQRIPIWRALGITHNQTRAAYADERFWTSIEVLDRDGRLALGHVRVDLTDQAWIGSWVTGPSLATELANAGPSEQYEHAVADPEVAVIEATDWLEQQLRRPISRRIWHRDGDIAASLWQLDDTGRAIVLGGDPTLRQNPDSADEITRVRG